MPPETPLYPLREVQNLAKSGKVGFSRTAQKGYQEIGLSNEQAKEKIAWLSESEFDKRKHYENPDQWWDVYLCPMRCADGVERTVYIKLLMRTGLPVEQVYVTSFHI